MASESIKLTSADGGTFDAYLAHPAGGPAPAVVMIHSAFGCNESLCGTADRFAARGFLMIAPDLFWRTHPGPLPQDDAGREKALERYKKFDVERGLDDLRTTIAAVKALPDCNGKVAMMGYCMGGRYAFLGITRLGADAAVSFHGTNIGEHLGEAQLRNPKMSLHFGGDDPLVPAEEIKAIKGALEGFPEVMIYVYPGAKHGFAQIGSRAYDPAAAELAEKRALDFLDGLKQPVPA
jgi:carboxymethylenebutenolidase